MDIRKLKKAAFIDIDKQGNIVSEKIDVDDAKKQNIITICYAGNEIIVWSKPTIKQINTIVELFEHKLVKKNAFDTFLCEVFKLI